MAGVAGVGRMAVGDRGCLRRIVSMAARTPSSSASSYLSVDCVLVELTMTRYFMPGMVEIHTWMRVSVIAAV